MSKRYFHTTHVLGSATHKPDILSNLNNKILDCNLVSETQSELHVYADGTNGKDSNDGTTVNTPKKTLQAVIDLVPFFIKHNTCIHLTGIFEEFGSPVCEKYIFNNVIFLIDGGNSLTTVADNAGNPWISDIHSVLSIGLSTAEWITDQYAGYMVEILDGVCIGQHRLIHSNTSTTITVIKEFSTDPGICNFRISRPSTTLTSSDSFSLITFKLLGAGISQIQKLTLSGSNSNLSVSDSTAFVYLTHIIVTGTYSAPIGGSRMGVFTFKGAAYNSLTFKYESSKLFSTAAVGVINLTSKVLVNINRFEVRESFLPIIENRHVNHFFARYGTRIEKMILLNSKTLSVVGGNNLITDSGYAVTRIGGIDSGIILVDSSIDIGQGVDISNCSGHAIICNHSKLYFDGNISGSNNGGFGVYAHNNSVINTKSGTPPTLSGSLGELSVDGITEVSTWQNIENGNPVAVLSEMTMAKKI